MADERWLSTAEQHVWRRLLAVNARLRDRLDAELQAAHGLGLGDYEVLVHLSEASGASLRMSELAERVLLSPSGLTRRIDGMVRHGLVTRRACPSDRRGSLAELTPAGQALVERAAVTHVAGVRQYLIDPLAGECLQALAEGLGRIEAALGVPVAADALSGVRSPW